MGVGQSMTELIQHKIIRCNDIKDHWNEHWCMTCEKEFKAGEDRHEWRMYLLYKDDQYRKCGYWVTSCHECFVKNMVALRENVNEQIDSMPQSMRELA